VDRRRAMKTRKARDDEGGRGGMDEERSGDLSIPPSPVKRRRHYLELAGMLAVFLILFPIIPVTIAVVFGGILAWAESEDFVDGFLYVASNVLGMAEPLTEFNPTDPIGAIIDVYVSVVAILCFGIVINIVNVFQMPHAINQGIENMGITHPFFVALVACGFIIPLCFALVGVVFGSILASLEGWSVIDGILYIYGTILGLGTPLTSVVPDTIGGDIVDIIIASMALGCIAIFVDYATVLNPGKFLRKLTREFLIGRRLIKECDVPCDHPLALSLTSLVSAQEVGEESAVGINDKASILDNDGERAQFSSEGVEEEFDGITDEASIIEIDGDQFF